MTDEKRREVSRGILAGVRADEAAGRPVSRPDEQPAPEAPTPRKPRPAWAVTKGGLVKFTVYFTEEELARVKARAEAEGIAAAAVVRRAVRRDLGR